MCKRYYFRDISFYDPDGWNKITRESGPAAGFGLAYLITDWFGISGEVFTGRIAVGNSVNTCFIPNRNRFTDFR